MLVQSTIPPEARGHASGFDQVHQQRLAFDEEMMLTQTVSKIADFTAYATHCTVGILVVDERGNNAIERCRFGKRMPIIRPTQQTAEGAFLIIVRVGGNFLVLAFAIVADRFFG